MRQRFSVNSLVRYSTCPGPAGQVMMRQKLALVVSGSPSFRLSRMNGFSPVRITRLGSAGIGVTSSKITLRSSPLRAKPGASHNYFSSLLNVPHEDRGGADVALNILAQGGLGKGLPGWNVWDDLKGALLHLGGNFLARFGIRRVYPLHAQLLELVVCWPAEPSLLAIGAQHNVGRRVERVGPDPAGLEHVPAALRGRFLRGAARHHGPPVASHILHVEPKLFQHIGRNQRIGMDIRLLDR